MRVRRLVHIAAAAAMLLSGTGASAALVLQASGTVTSISAFEHSSPTAVPTGSINVGDAYTLTATFDPDQAIVSPTFDADPTVNIYSLPGVSVSFDIGSYSRSFTPSFSFDALAQLWNDHIIGDAADAQSFSFTNFDVPGSTVPFNLGAGLILENVDQLNIDLTASARSDDLITNLAPLTLFPSQLFTYGLLNSDTQLFVFVVGSVSEASLTSTTAVPEPSTWALMIIGFVAIGTAMRRRKKSSQRTLRGRPFH